VTRIYVSSTFSDLKEYRERVQQVLRSLGHEDISMENYVASEDRPLDKCRSDVANSDLYLGIVAWRYGYIPVGFSQSITELEYLQAIASGKDCLIFLVDEKAPWPRSLMDRDDTNVQLFRDHLVQAHTVSFFSTLDDLQTKVSLAVSKWDKENYHEANNQQVFQQYERVYRSQVVNRHGYIVPSIVDSQRRKIPLDSLYVTPQFTSITENVASTKESKLILFDSFVNNIHRTVLLGNPGAGKSTLANKLCLDLASRDGNDSSIIPVLVTVRDYGVERKSLSRSILDFIKLKANSDYQIRPPDHIFEHWLQNGLVLIIFDGLDELLDTTDREAITSDIEAFCRLYPLIHVLVTSREVGYREAPLDRSIFGVFKIADFDDSQVSEYVQKWFNFEMKDQETGDEGKAQPFLEELVFVPKDVKTNPLMLATLCAIYRGEGYIPRNRPEIYEHCSRLLFEKRDRERHIKYNLPFEEHVRPTIAYLAHWIYEDVTLQSGVVERKLIRKATEFLLAKRFDDIDEAESAAQKFVEFCTGRAWVFTDTGTTKEGERLYQFTHRAFLEYFTALHLVRTHATAKELLDVLQQRIAKREWDVVAQLAFQKKAQDVDGAADDLLMTLVTQSELALEQEAINILIFVAECLAFMVPRATTIRALLDASFKRGLPVASAAIEEEGIEEIYKESPFYDNDNFFRSILFPLGIATAENLPIITANLESLLVPLIQSGTDYNALIAAEIGLNLSALVRRNWQNDHPDNVERLFADISRKIMDNCSEHLLGKLCPQYIRPALDLYYAGRVNIRQLVDWHGTQILFEQHYYVAISSIYDQEVAPGLLSDLCRGDLGQKMKQEYLDQIQLLGQILLHEPTPWAIVDVEDTWMMGGCHEELPPFNGDLAFGVFIILAFLHERWYEVHHQYLTIKDFETTFPERFHWIFVMRLGQLQVDDDLLHAEINRFQFSPEQRLFVEKWANQGIGVIN